MSSQASAADSGFYQHWQALNDFLACHAGFWRPVPFTDPNPAWRSDYPSLAAWLDALDDDRVEELRQDPALVARAAARHVPSLADWPTLVDVPSLNPEGAIEAHALPERRAVDMPGRKRLQAGAFASAALPLQQPVLDWCCGKGHLARTLAAGGAKPVTGLEWDAALVADGNALAARYGDPVHICHQDVLAPDLHWPGNTGAVALHACGDLHQQLLRAGARAAAPRLVLSPCCYQKRAAPVFQPLSERLSKHAGCLALTRQELSLAVQETVTAPARERVQLDRISAWRLGFDALQRDCRQQDTYLPVPRHPSSLNRGDFEGFCRWAAQKKSLTLPANVDWMHWQVKGLDRLGQVRRHELLRHLFRRPLELWLVLDYALFLEEAGYNVRLGTFCERAMTPRNLMLDARRG